MKPINLKVVLKLLTPLHVGGEPGTDANTSYILIGADKKAYYPGTAFKGKARYYASQIASDKDAVLRLFGDEGNAKGSLFFSNFQASNELKDIRAGNSIDRCRRVAEDEKLFTTESAAMEELTGCITGSASDDDIELLKNSIALIQQIGGSTGRGFGWLSEAPQIFPISTDETPEKTNGGSAENEKSAECVSVKLVPLSPMLIGNHTAQANFRDTRMTVPGSVLRAALARAICKLDGTENTSKEGIKTGAPENGETRFENLRREFENLRFSVLNSDIQGEPYPITTRKCKSDESHEKMDVLAAILNSKNVQCPACGERYEKENKKMPASVGRLEKVEPYEAIKDYEKKRDDKENDCKENDCTEQNRKLTFTSTHSQIDNYRGAAQDERLYTIRAIAPNTITFYGTITGSLRMAELSRFTRAKIHTGAMTSSGFGLCDIYFESISQPREDARDIKKRIEKFNELIIKKEEHFFFIPITLMSDAVVSLEEPKDGDGGKPADYVKPYAELIPSPLKLERVITKLKTWRGFDTSTKNACEKAPVFLMQAGSVLVASVNALDTPVLETLAEMERAGIGFKKEDGYGAVRIAHKNHIEGALKQKEE